MNMFKSYRRRGNSAVRGIQALSCAFCLGTLSLTGCSSMEREVQSPEAVRFTIGMSRERVLQRLDEMNGKVISDHGNVVVAELPAQGAMRTELMFDDGKLKSITYVPK